MKTIFTEIRRWLSEPVLVSTGAEPRLSRRDWADMPVFHPVEHSRRGSVNGDVATGAPSRPALADPLCGA